MKSQPAMQEMWHLIPGWEDALEEEIEPTLHYSCLGNCMDRGAWQATIYRVARVGHELATKTTTTTPEYIRNSYNSKNNKTTTNNPI